MLGRFLDLAGQARDFLVDGGNLRVECLDDGVNIGELHALLAAFLLQLQQAGLQLDGRVKVVFSFGAQVKGAVLVAELVEPDLRVFQLLFELRQKVTQESE